MAFDRVDASAVYLCTGNPKPEDIEAVVNWLLNFSMVDAYESERIRWHVAWWHSSTSKTVVGFDPHAGLVLIFDFHLGQTKA